MKIYVTLLIFIFVLLSAVLPTAFCKNTNEELLLSDTGFPPISSIDVPKIIACSIFGAIGFVAFVYGRKMRLIPPTIIGILLIAFPYLISSGVLIICIIGCILTVALFIYRS